MLNGLCACIPYSFPKMSDYFLQKKTKQRDYCISKRKRSRYFFKIISPRGGLYVAHGQLVAVGGSEKVVYYFSTTNNVFLSSQEKKKSEKKGEGMCLWNKIICFENTCTYAFSQILNQCF